MILRHAKRAHVGLGYLVAAAVIATALLLGLLGQALPWLARNPRHVDAWLEHRTGRPVEFSAMRAHWTRRGPLVELEGLRIGAGDEAFHVGDAELLASIYSGLLPGQSFSELRLRGLDVVLERRADGTWHVRGLPGQEQTTGDPFEALEALGELHIVGGRLSVLAPAYGIEGRIPRVDLRMRVDGTRVRAGLRAWPARGVQPVDGVLDFDRATGNGRAYAGAAAASLADWTSLLRAAGIAVQGGRGQLRAWAELRAHRVASVIGEGRLEGVSLVGAPLDGTTPRVVFDELDVLGHWRARPGQWRVDLPRLRMRQQQSQQTLDGLVVAGGGRFSLSAARVDASPLLQALALTDRIEPGLRRWLRQAQPFGMAEAVRVDGERGRTRVQARLASLGFNRVGTAPGLRGVTGQLRGDAEGLEFDFDRRSPVRFTWPQAFGPDHVVRLGGRATAWREGDGWRVESAALRIDGEGYAADVRGGLWWQGDGSRPWIDLAADIDPAQVPVAKRFWVRHVMPAPVVRWLDTALVGGTLTDGRAIVTGDLDDWPFRDGEGRFEARGRLVGTTLRYQPDWPAAEDVQADVAFVGTGFSVSGTGRIGRVGLSRLSAGIDDYAGGALTVEAAAATDAGALLELVRASPLRALQRETVDALTASGPARVDFRLGLPLGRGAPIAIDGAVALAGARLGDRRWNLQFDGVRGRARYDRNGFSAPDLAVRHEGQAGRLSLRAGSGHVREADNAFEGAVDASFDIDALLARAPEMAWLAPHVAGRSAWSVGVVVPRAAPGAATVARLQLRSGLAGTSLDLPAPLRKPAGQPLAAFVDTPLPLGSGEISVGLGNLVGVRARTVQGRTGVRVQLGSGRADEPPPPEGLVATGRAAQLDALDWIAFARGGSPGSNAGNGGAGLRLQRVDINAQQLVMLGGRFPDVRLQLQPGPGGTLVVRADGAPLSGSVQVPADDGPVTGRFARVFWSPAARAASATASTRPRAPAPGPAMDPASIPALAFDIDDLRFGDARLGAARVRTRPVAAGLRLEQFTAGGRGQAINATGDWTGRGSAARTRLRADVDSRDIGALLGGFGLGGRVGGGRGTARLDATWSGSPAEFSLATLQGSLALDTRDGRLLEVEPGAGRVLGLLSLAELPKRLTLDFRDFFAKGFAFNQLRGTVRFGAGEAHSDDLAIRGPAADIDIRGAADLRAQTFDQTIEVRPKSGNLLTAVGALAGGPVGAAIGAATSAVLRKPLGQIGAKTYRVTGPWADPKVEVMTREQTRLHAAAPPAG